MEVGSPGCPAAGDPRCPLPSGGDAGAARYSRREPSPTTLTERTFLAAGEELLLLSPPTTASSYRALTPPPALRACADRIDLGHELVPDDAPLEERVLPDGAVHLVFDFGDVPAVLGEHGGALAPAGVRMMAIGAACAPTVIRMAGHVEGVGVRLRPGAAAALLGVPAGEIAGRCVPLEALWGGAAARDAFDRLAAAPHGALRAAVLERVLLERLGADGAAAHAAAVEAVRRIGETGGRVTVRALAAALGVGERRLEQLFREHVGLTPKAACRLARFHASVRLLRREPAHRCSELAHRMGYADHAHLVHEFRALAGLTPTELRARLDFGFPQDARPASR